MTSHSLLNLSPLDGRYAKQVDNLRLILSEYGLFYFRTIVEVEWFKFLFQEKIVSEQTLSINATDYINTIISQFSLKDAERIKQIEQTTNHDVKAVEYFLKEKMAENSELKPLLEWIHFGCTSEDINNLSYGLMFKKACTEYLIPQIGKILEKLQYFTHTFSSMPMLARTHGQSASPTTIGKEFANVTARLMRQIEQLNQQTYLGKFNGAVGNYNAHIIAFPQHHWPELAKKFVESLNLTFNPLTTQIEPHDYLSEMSHHFIRMNTILIDLDRDIWGYISQHYFRQKIIAGEVGSSTMPHKVNPIDFENSEGNLSLANAIFSFLAERLPISRWQRDLVDSTLLRNIAVAMGHTSLGWNSLIKGLNKLDINQNRVAEDLAEHPEVLAEAIQTLMRARGIEQAYEKLKELTRGKVLTLEILREFIQTQPLSKEDKTSLLKLEPKDYTGLARELSHLEKISGS
jgi:adenylosuccinate lyase